MNNATLLARLESLVNERFQGVLEGGVHTEDGACCGARTALRGTGNPLDRFAQSGPMLGSSAYR